MEHAGNKVYIGGVVITQLDLFNNGLKTLFMRLSPQMSHVPNKDKLQVVYLTVSNLPQLIEVSMQNVQNHLHNISKEIQEISCNLKMLQPLANYVCRLTSTLVALTNQSIREVTFFRLLQYVLFVKH
ncbi:hypothetical protein VNO78_26724 [Psophocarpus tetragonolobus]|uniref:Uncharacterized protein n=1 Tax=Psophocarpus tetragonolobus TaxID=3891 RepID=A0AAN9X8W1_PSOTE